MSPNVTRDTKPQIFCDICEELEAIIWYHCDVCHFGDYDICEACFAKGLHFKDAAHFIRKIERDDVNLDNYYYSIGSSGRRNILKY